VILFILNREYMSRMFTTPCGWLMSGVAVFIVVLGFIIMRRVIKIEI
jgi:Flp pilus assembly protein TadB